MYRNILLAYDGSPDGCEALTQARLMAAQCGAAVQLLAILNPSENLLPVEGMAFFPDKAQALTQSMLDEAERHLRMAGCAATSAIRYGDPAEQIVASARAMPADLIVVGHRNQGTLARWLNGSVGAAILHHAPCSVLVAVAPARPAGNVTSIESLRARRQARKSI